MPRSTNTREMGREVNKAINSLPKEQARLLKEYIDNLKNQTKELEKQLDIETQIKNTRKQSNSATTEALIKQQDLIENLREQRDAYLYQIEKEYDLGILTYEEFEKRVKKAYELDDIEKSMLKTREGLLLAYNKEQRAQVDLVINEHKRRKELEDAKKYVQDRINYLEEENKQLDKNSEKYKKNAADIAAAKGQLERVNKAQNGFFGTDSTFFSDFTSKAFKNNKVLGAYAGVLDGAVSLGSFIRQSKSEEGLLKFSKDFKKEFAKASKNIEDIEDINRKDLKEKEEAKEKTIGNFGEFLSSFGGKSSGEEAAGAVENVAEEAQDAKGNIIAGVAGIITDFVGDKLVSLVDALDPLINKGAEFQAANKGIINASLWGMGGFGTADYYTRFIKNANDKLTGSMLISFEDYLSNIKNLATQGIGSGVEIAALLSTVAEKTVPQFNASSSYLRRLVLLGEKAATQRYFGLESIIQKTLNSQFGESSYLNQLFESVNANLQDAITNLSDKLGSDNQYKFLTSAQTWLGSLYEQGVDSQTITRISNVINALGSGNISAMASDAGMQKLMLLAMDQANIDYATLLQKGFTTYDVDTLLYNMVEYLHNVSSTTNANNVLESAYANLFGLSMTDMYAFRKINPNSIKPMNVSSSAQVEAETKNRLGMIESGIYTPLSEKIDNLFDNIKFDFSSKLAYGSNYAMLKGGKFAYNLADSIDDMPIIGAAADAVKLLSVGAMAGGALLPLIGVATDLVESGVSSIGFDNNTVVSLYDKISGNYSTSSSSINMNASSEDVEAINNFKTIADASSAKFSGDEYQITNEMAEEELNKEDPMLVILKELEKSFMENTEGKMALAVSLQGMSNEVLKSFASIFADEESMTDIFGDKDTDKRRNNLFKYGADDEASSGEKSPNSNVYSSITSIS